MKHILFFIFFFCTFFVNAQSNEGVNSAGVYTDYLHNEQGQPLEGVQVRVRGTGETTTTNFNGEFTVHAKNGDVLVFSENGIIINSITLNNTKNYILEDVSEQEETLKEEKKTSSKNRKSLSKIRSTKQYRYILDSAAHYAKINSDKSIAYIENALQISEVKNNTKLLAESYTILGDVYSNLRQYDLAITSYQTALESKQNNTVSIKLATAYYQSKAYNNSIKTYKKTLTKELSSWQKTLIFEGLGDNYKQTNNLKTAQLYYNKGLKIAIKHHITPKISDLNAKLGNISVSQGKRTDAEDYFNKSLVVSKKENLQKQAQVNNTIANAYKQGKDYDKEIELRKETLSVLEEAEVAEMVVEPISDEKVSVQQLNFDIGNAYKNKKAYPEAIVYLEKSKTEANKLADIEVEKDAVRQLSELYNKIGNSKKALKSYKEYAKLVDKLYKTKEAEIETAITLNKDLSAKQGRINSLEKDRKLSESKYQLYQSEKQLTVENNKRQQVIIYALLGGLLLLLFSMYTMHKSNKQSKLANNLLALKSLRSQMNPHFIFNALNSVNSFIAQNDERSANRYLTEFSTLMRSVLNNSEEDFIPLDKEIELLQLYLKLEHSRFKDKFDYTIDIDKKLQISEFQIPPMLLQPYVENAVWHGLRYKKEKGNLSITMRQKDTETIEITISDDGIGREQSKALKTENQLKQQSKGMNNIKKRIAILNKMYQDKVAVFIENLYTDQTGTKVTLTLKKD